MNNEKILITKSQHRALDNIRGLEQSAQHMVICAKETPKGYILEGSEKTFDSLMADISDEIFYEMQPPAQIKHLRQLMCLLEPECDDF